MVGVGVNATAPPRTGGTLQGPEGIPGRTGDRGPRGEDGPPGDPTVLLSGLAPGDALTVDGDGNPAPLSVVSRDEYEATAALSTNAKVALLGDSITAANTPTTSGGLRAPRRGWFHWASIATGGGWRGVYAGISGDRTADMLARLDADVIAHAPSACVVLGGTNDLSNDVPAATTIANLAAIYDALRAARVAVVACTILPRTGLTTPQAARLYEVNRWIRETAATQRGITLCDWADSWAQADGSPVADVTHDGLHPSSYGSQLLGARLAPILQRLVPVSSPVPLAGDPTNLLGAGGMQAGTAGTVDSPLTGQVATGWRLRVATGTPSAAGSKVARTDGRPGAWTQIALASGAVNYYYNVTGLTAGQVLHGTIEYEIDSPSGITTFSAQTYASGSAYSAVLDDVPGESLSIAPPAKGLIVIPNFTVPAATSAVWLLLRVIGGSATVRVGRCELRTV